MTVREESQETLRKKVNTEGGMSHTYTQKMAARFKKEQSKHNEEGEDCYASDSKLDHKRVHPLGMYSDSGRDEF